MITKFKTIIALCMLLCILHSAVLSQTGAEDQQTGVRSYQQLITAESLAARLYFLASDFFEGRETGTRGQRLAAHYLASQYRQLGLTPKGTQSATNSVAPEEYFQSFSVFRRTPKQSRLEVSIDNKVVASSTFSADSHDDLSFFFSGGFNNTSGEVVFAGYGIADEKLGYNDYKALAENGLSIDGKWVLIFEDEPLLDAKTSLLPTQDKKPSSWSGSFINKKSAMWRAGRPKGVLVVSDVSPLLTDPFTKQAEDASTNAQRIGGLSLVSNPEFPPSFAISTKLANQLLAPSGHTVAKLKQQLDSKLKPAPFNLARRVTVSANLVASDAVKTENVAAFIEGSDPKLKDEVVIISAHYDHLGLNPSLKGDQIFNGAADDGSGVVACLEMAQWFMKAKREGHGPRRSILFINFSGEEKGLLGSTYYNQFPLIPLEQTVADINMDGVGGIDVKHPTQSKNYIYVVGQQELSSELIDSAKLLNTSQNTNLELTLDRQFGSDHQSFAAQLIPYIYYSTGLTEKYHQVGDEPNTIDYEHFARVVRLIFASAWQTANQENRVKSVDRKTLKLAGYVCPPCPFACDDQEFSHPGECPVCGMTLSPKYGMR
jgi:hypothetical protein